MTCTKYFWAEDQDGNALPFAADFVLQIWQNSQWVVVNYYTIPRGGYYAKTLLDYPQQYKAIPILDIYYEDDWERPNDEIFTCRSSDIVFVYEKKAPAPGTLAVGSIPSGAKIYVNNVYKGITPSTSYLYITLQPGTYSVKLTLDGYEDATTGAQVVSGRTTYYKPTLTALPTCTKYFYAEDQDGNALPFDANFVLQIWQGSQWVQVGVYSIPSGAPLGVTGLFTHPQSYKAIPYSTIGYEYLIPGDETFTCQSSDIVFVYENVEPPPGHLAVGSTPHGASIYVDGVYQGTTPHPSSPSGQYKYITLPVGYYDVKLTLDGYKDATVGAWIESGKTTYYSPVLEALTGDVYVTGELSDGTALTGAEIYVDDVATGVLTPGTVTTSVGSHTIVAKKDV